MPSLEEIADEAGYMLSDDMSDERYEEFLEKSAEERVRYFFCSSDCDAFAIAVHRMTEWPIRALGSPQAGFIHRLVEAPDGRFLDAGGWQTLETLKRRYGIKETTLSRPGGEELATGFCENDFDGIDESLKLAVAAIRQLPWEPFGDPEFRAISEKPFAGVDYPYPDHEEGDAPSP